MLPTAGGKDSLRQRSERRLQVDDGDRKEKAIDGGEGSIERTRTNQRKVGHLADVELYLKARVRVGRGCERCQIVWSRPQAIYGELPQFHFE